jgi:hypothetical protein
MRDVGVCSLLLFALGACSSNPTTPQDAGTDVTPDAGKPSPPPLAPETDPEPLDVPQWMVTTTSNPAVSDPVRLELEQGAFTMPASGTRSDGTWIVRKPDASGGIGTPSSTSLLYGAATVDVPAGRRVFARADAVLSVWTDSALVQPGDVYGTQKLRVCRSRPPTARTSSSCAALAVEVPCRSRSGRRRTSSSSTSTT